ncbi:MAG TPA: response regulator [Bryobacteraceae bacterium]|jgi:CheY-like chemotaxis protein|nr:response regulator [Bryobacteraceae bacterium]
MNLRSADDMTRVLIVEDNPVDAEMVERALQEEQSWTTETTVADDGEKAIELLLEHRGGRQQRPDLVILDLNLPKRDGAEVLQVIRTTDELRSLPVVVLSSSPMHVMKSKVHKANVEANCYLTKPADLDEFLALGKRLRYCYEKALGSKS